MTGPSQNKRTDIAIPGETCPIPISQYPRVLLAHGGGGRLMHRLIEKMFIAAFKNPHLETRHDGAVLDYTGKRLAFTTDSYVVRPLFFPGGDIGSLAVNGTVNDLAMCGARPLCLSAGFIIEEGLPMETLWRVVRSMQCAADAAGVTIVTGDTKVIERRTGDELFINTSGIGSVEHDSVLNPQSIRPGDVVLINGDIGRHGIAIMAQREGLAFEGAVESDCAALWGVVETLLRAGINIRCLRDLTRGGLGTVLVEIAEASTLAMQIDESAIPVREEVRGACEILGLDPLYVANEGRVAVFVSPQDAGRALATMRKHPLGTDACIIGQVTGEKTGRVLLASRIGSTRIVDMPSGEQLPRIC